MSIIAATSFLGKPLEYARNILAASTAWQTLCGAEDATEAKEFIEYDRSENIGGVRCLIELSDETTIRQVSSGGFNGEGVTRLGFYVPVSEDNKDNFSNMYLEHLDRIGPVLADLVSLTRNANTENGYLAIQQINAGEHGQVDPDEENGVVVYVSEWTLRHHL